MSLSCPSSLWIEDTAQDFEKAIGALIISAEILHWTAAVGLSAYSLPLLAVFETAKYIQIVTEKVTGGELFDRIVTKDHFNETEAAKVFVQIIEAIDYLHSIGVVHRDLKPENVLYSSPDDDSTIKIAGDLPCQSTTAAPAVLFPQVSLFCGSFPARTAHVGADFGLGKLLPLDKKKMPVPMRTVCGTPIYVAPEVLLRKGYGDQPSQHEAQSAVFLETK